MNLYGLFILDVNIKYVVFSILCRQINVPMTCKELITKIMLLVEDSNSKCVITGGL